MIYPLYKSIIPLGISLLFLFSCTGSEKKRQLEQAKADSILLSYDPQKGDKKIDELKRFTAKEASTAMRWWPRMVKSYTKLLLAGAIIYIKTA
jgi:hypothetical protein